MLHSLFLVVFPNLCKKSPGSFSFWKLSGDSGVTFDYYGLSPRSRWAFAIELFYFTATVTVADAPLPAVTDTAGSFANCSDCSIF